VTSKKTAAAVLWTPASHAFHIDGAELPVLQDVHHPVEPGEYWHQRTISK